MPLPDIIEAQSRHKYHPGAKLFEGDLADLYTAYGATHPKGGAETILLKVARDRRDNDLLDNEIDVLNFLYPKGQKDEKFYRYLPRVIDTARSPDGRRIIILPYFEGFLSMADIIAAYPAGIDFRDMIWMYKRLLSGLGFVAEMGVVHGAILPPHVLVHPEGHGAKILDWSYALNFAALAAAQNVPDPVPAATSPAPAPTKKLGVWELLRQNLYADDDADPPDPALPKGPPPDPNRMYVKAISVNYESFYAPEILRKETPSPATDVYMAAKCAIALLGGNVETNQLPEKIMRGDPAASGVDEEKARAQLQAFFQVSLLANPRKRPQDPWQVHEDFDKLLVSLVGPPKYRLFTMPTQGGTP